MFFANSSFGGKKFADIRNEAKQRVLAGVTYMKLVFALMLCVVSAVTAVMIDYMILNVIDVSGVLAFASGGVWLALELGSYFVLVILVALPLGCGWVRFLRFLTLEKDVSLLECFFYFKDVKTYLRTLSFVLPFGLKLGFVALVSWTFNFLASIVPDPFSLLVTFALNVLLVLSVALVVLLMGRRFCSLAIFIRNDEMSPAQIRRMSRRLSHGRLWRIFRYKLAYFPDMLLTLVTVLIYGGVYFAPIYTAAYFDAVDEILSVCDGEL